MGVSKVVQDFASSRSVNAAENDIAVERRPIPLLFSHAVWEFFYHDFICRRDGLDASCSHIYFQFSNVSPSCDNQTVEVMDLNFVEVDK